MIHSSEIKIGTKYMSAGKHPRQCIVVDVYKTYNNNNELVKCSFVSEYEFLGQKVKNYDVCAVTIQKGFIG